MNFTKHKKELIRQAALTLLMTDIKDTQQLNQEGAIMSTVETKYTVFKVPSTPSRTPIFNFKLTKLRNFKRG